MRATTHSSSIGGSTWGNARGGQQRHSTVVPRFFGGGPRNTANSQRRSTKIKRARVWNDDLVSSPILSASVSYLAISFLALMSTLLCLIYGTPKIPSSSSWYSYGWLLQMPDLAAVLLAIPLHLNYFKLLKVVLGISIALTTLTLYTVAINIAWIYGYFSNTLTAAARAHQSIIQTLPLILILFVILFFHLFAIAKLSGVISIVPDLQRMNGVEDELDDEGTYVDDENHGDDIQVDEK